jgi:hypothetical protein
LGIQQNDGRVQIFPIAAAVASIVDTFLFIIVVVVYPKSMVLDLLSVQNNGMNGVIIVRCCSFFQ